MLLLGLDFETFWSTEYTLRKMQPREYINDHRFEIIGVAIKHGLQPAFWLHNMDEISLYMSSIPWNDTFVYGHNLVFDGGILTWKFGVNPRMWLDTLSMGRALIRPFTGDATLAACAEYLDLGEPKGSMATQMKDVRKAHMSPMQLRAYGEYACHDIDLSFGILQKLQPKFSDDELRLIDRTMRMYLEPRIQLDGLALADHLKTVVDEKNAMTMRVGETRKTLMSNPQFADVLRELGVEPPMKISPTTGEPTFAFAKKDLEFAALLEHPDNRVQAVVGARLGVKSTLEETRTARLLDIANTFGSLAVPLLYAGAHTGRFSGGGKLNLQNLPRGSAIRMALLASASHLFVVADASQIEARLLAWFCGQSNIVAAFAANDDVYAITAAKIYGYPVTKATHPDERQVGKVAVLQLGYGSGAETFWHMCRTQDEPIDIEREQAQTITNVWRRNNKRIVEEWYKLFGAVQRIFLKKVDHEEPYRCIVIGYSTALDAGYIRLPGGYTLWYPSPGIGEDKHGRKGFGYVKAMKRARFFKVLWHGEIMNNVIQALARVITMKHGLLISNYPAAPWVLQVHDELVFHVRNVHAQAVADACTLVMSTPPSWAPDLPLACEVHIGQRYGECK